MKRIACFILATMLLLSVIPFAAFAANGPTVSISVSGDVCPGGTLDVTVAISGNTGFLVGAIDVALPAGFTVKSGSFVKLNDQIGQTLFNETNAHYAWISTMPQAVDGDLFKFTVIADASVVVGSNPVFGFDSAEFALDYTSQPTSPTQQTPAAGSVTVVACADTDNDHLCDTCGKEMSQCIDANDDNICDICNLPICNHVAGTPVEENRVAASCTAPGSYDTVTYCTLCNKELSRVTTPIPQENHVDANNDTYCDVCNTYLHACTVTSKLPISVIPATCNKYGYINYLIYCVKCNKPLAFSTTILTILAEHEDTDNDGNCDTCDKQIGEPVHVHDLVHTEAKEATCFEEGNLEYWYCEGCDCYFTDAEGKYNIARLSLITPVAHKVEHVEAKEPTATENGNIEYWYCTDCGYAWLDEFCTKNTNLKAVILPATGEVEHVHTIAYVPAAEACHVPGTVEFWYCTDPTCEIVFADEALTQVTNRKNLATEAVIELVHHEAIAPCHANGYLEYWYCPKCDNYFADAAATQQTNIKNLTVEGDLSKLAYTAKVEATATENGMNEYWYCAGCDCFFTDAEGKYNIAYLSLTIPATGEIDNPQTGDNAIFFIVAVVAVATLGIAAVSFKKREEN